VVTGREHNRRQFPRKKKPYRGAFTVDGWRTQEALIGLDISAGGMCFLLQRDLNVTEIEVRAMLENHPVVARVTRVWGDKVQHQSKIIFRWGARFSAISADDWDTVVRWVNDQAVEQTNQAQADLKRVRMSPDDTARLLPQVLQTKLLKILVSRQRLAPLDPKITPLVQYFYSGIQHHHGKTMHRIEVQSKLIDAQGDNQLFETVFLVDEGGSVVPLDTSEVSIQKERG
jgi:PilZ domain